MKLVCLDCYLVTHAKSLIEGFSAQVVLDDKACDANELLQYPQNFENKGRESVQSVTFKNNVEKNCMPRQPVAL